MKLILLGAPGAGKGTQAEFISEEYAIPAISTGNIIREAMKNGTKPGLEAKSFLEAGTLVPDQTVIAMLKERLAQEDCKNGYILDGFPRTVIQAHALEEMGIVIDKAIEISVSDEEVQSRLGGRRVCDKCGASYHVKFKPSTKGDGCDKCDGKLVVRADDKPEVIRQRLEIYHRETEPIKNYYDAMGKLGVVIGQNEVEDTKKITLATIGDLA